MLKIKQAIDDCGIKQSIVATITGWSPGQISVTFNTGKFPTDAERFKASMRAFVEVTPPLINWLQERFLCPDDLFADLSEPVEPAEFPGTGPDWACDSYGHPGHDYYGCPDCQRRFEGRMAMLRGRAAVMGGAV